MFSPFTAICILINPAEYGAADFGPGGIYKEAPLIGRIFLFILTVVASGAICFIIWGMYKSMVKNFDMIIRRQHQ
jgi:hypothetical protein